MINYTWSVLVRVADISFVFTFEGSGASLDCSEQKGRRGSAWSETERSTRAPNTQSTTGDGLHTHTHN